MKQKRSEYMVNLFKQSKPIVEENQTESDKPTPYFVDNVSKPLDEENLKDWEKQRIKHLVKIWFLK